MTRQYVKNAIKSDFARRFAAVTDKRQRYLVKTARQHPEYTRLGITLMLDNDPSNENLDERSGDTITILPNVQVQRWGLGYNANITIDSPNSPVTALFDNPFRLGSLHLQCHDIEDLSGYWRDIPRFSEEDAQRFWEFVLAMKAKAKARGLARFNWVISCGDGVSASAACAVALARWLGNPDAADHIANGHLPNQHILSVLEEARKSFLASDQPADVVEQVYDFAPDESVPACISQCMVQAVTATKRRLKEWVTSGESPFGAAPSLQEATEVARAEANLALAPARENSGLSITQWFDLFYGEETSLFRDKFSGLETMYQRYQQGAMTQFAFQAKLDSLYGHLVDAAALQIVADCRDEGLI